MTDKFPRVLGARVDSLHNLVADALPDNGEWHTLAAMVRKVDGVLQVDELMLRRDVDGVSHGPRFTAGAKHSGIICDPTEPYPTS